MDHRIENSAFNIVSSGQRRPHSRGHTHRSVYSITLPVDRNNLKTISFYRATLIWQLRPSVCDTPVSCHNG